MTMTMIDPAALVGFVAFDAEGEQLGEVEGVYLGTEEPEWAAVLVGTCFAIVPLLDAEVYEDSLAVPFTAAEVMGAPLQQPQLLEDLTEEQEAQLLAYYASPSAAGAGKAGAMVASTAKEQGLEVAATAKEQGQQVAATVKEQGQQVAATVKEQSQQVLRSTADQAGEVVGTAREQAGAVAQQATLEARNLLEQARAQLEDQAAEGAHTLGENLSRLGHEALALAEGRPQEAPTVQGYVRRTGETLLDAADRAYGLSEDVRTRGIGGLLTDVQSFARRRPGAFLLGTAVVGVLAGRAVRNAKEHQEDEDDGRPAQPRGANGQSAAAPARTRGGR